VSGSPPIPFGNPVGATSQQPPLWANPAAPRDHSTAVVIVVVVAALILIGPVVAGFIFFDLGVIQPGGPGNTPIGSAFQVENPSSGLCPSSNSFSSDGCEGPGHYYYRVQIESSTVTFGSVSFIVHTASGAICVTPGGLGFTILTQGRTVAAQYVVSAGVMAMSSGWTYAPGTSSGSPLTNDDSIVIDMGTLNPVGRFLNLQALGVGSYSGTTSSQALP
jgi:hypothetical protein